MQLPTPEPPSTAVQVGAGGTEPVGSEPSWALKRMVGAVASTRIPEAVAVERLPAASVAVPVAVCGRLR